MVEQSSIIQLVKYLFDDKVGPYLLKVREALNADEKWLHGFRHILQFSSLTLYVGKNHIALEYSQFNSSAQVSENSDLKEISLYYHFFPEEEEILDRVLGFEQLDSKPEFRIPIPIVVENLFVPLGDSLEFMLKNGWNIDAQMRHQTSLMAFGPGLIGLTVPKNAFGSVRNSFFYDLDENNRLKVRYLKWVDLFPIKVEEAEDSWKISYWTPEIDALVVSALDYEPPELKKSQLDKLVKLNRFVELINSANIDEPEITRFLSQPENQFILKLYFSSKEIHSETQLKWQIYTDRADIRPDFFITMPNGFSDIVDFKLPNLEAAPIRGKENRKRFNAHLTEYAAQLREYRNYFDDYTNTKYVEDKFHIKVSKPMKYLIIGRRKDFMDEDWRDLQDDYKNLSIITYDDLIDAVTSAVYLIVE